MKHDITLISGQTDITGNITVKGELHIDGLISGNIFAEPDSAAVVKVSDKGRVEGQIQAPRVIINGRVSGNIFCSGHIELAQKADVEGDVHYHTIEMVLGSRVNGQLIHKEADSDSSGAPVFATETSGTDE